MSIWYVFISLVYVLFVLSMFCLCLVYVLSMSCVCLISVVSFSCLCLVYVLCMSCICLVKSIKSIKSKKSIKLFNSVEFVKLRRCGLLRNEVWDIIYRFIYFPLWNTIHSFNKYDLYIQIYNVHIHTLHTLQVLIILLLKKTQHTTCPSFLLRAEKKKLLTIGEDQKEGAYTNAIILKR